MTPAEYSATLRKQAQAIQKMVPLAIAAQTVHAMRVRRIFDRPGVGGQYTGGPMYIADKNLRRKGPHRGKTGKPIKTSYFVSYAAMKAQQGFDPSIVNMRLTNDLQSDFANSQKTTSAGAPPVGQVIKVNNGLYVEAIRRPKNMVKLQAGIKRFGNFIAFTPNERKEFQRIVSLEMARVLGA